MGRSCNYVDLSCVNIFSGTFHRRNLREAAAAAYYRYAVHGNYSGTACFRSSG